MPLKQKVEENWFVLAILLSVFVSGVTYQVLDVLVIEPLRNGSPQEHLDKPVDVPPTHSAPTDNRPAAGALIVDCQNEKPAMLGVLHDREGQFVFSPPAGASKPGETPTDTAIRETKEETGYTIDAGMALGRAPAGNPNFSLVEAAIDETKPANPHLQEVVGLLWANPSRIPANSWRLPEQREWIIELFEERAQQACP